MIIRNFPYETPLAQIIMAKQSPADPRFRCNVCKDYYSAPEHKVHYQCATHGYLCEKHIFNSDIKLSIKLYDKNINYIKRYSRKIEPQNFGTCMISSDGYDYYKKGINVYQGSSSVWKLFEAGGPSVKEGIQLLIEPPLFCLKKPIKFNWHEDVGRWIEEGKEEEEKAKAKPKKAAVKKADPTTQIRKFAKLRDDGLITEEEYQAKKKEILGL